MPIPQLGWHPCTGAARDQPLPFPSHPPGLESSFQDALRLVCGPVTICKGAHDKAHLVLEGAVSEAFYRVRDVIYAQYSVC